MPKKLRTEPIYIAPEITGHLDQNGAPQIFDERNLNHLDAHSVDDKITVYERQVNDWFLEPATNLSKYRNQNKGFIVLMICLSYLEGVEQYRRGQWSNNNSRTFFISALNRIYPGKFSQRNLQSLYREARCGLFHNGMVRGRIIIRNSYPESLSFENNDIKISPSKFLLDIKTDFESYINELRTVKVTRDRFDQLFTNL